MDKNILYRYFNAETSNEENIAIMNWAESSPENMKILENERIIWAALVLHSNTSNKRNYGRAIAVFFGGIAACLIIAFGLISLIKDTFTPSIIHVPKGQRTELLLSDGTRVWLNSNSTLEYKSQLFSRKRVVNLKGEGYFKVAKDKHRAFIVSTDKYDVKVLGTTFNVRSYNPESFNVSLIEGKVEVANRDNKDDVISLSSNQQANVSETGLVLSEITSTDDFTWKDGILTINNLPFKEIMKRFSDYYNVPIKVCNTQILDKTYTGKFRQSDGVYFSLELLKKIADFQYQYDAINNRIIIEE